MNTVKLKEALAELQQQRTILNGAITNIQNVLAMLEAPATNGQAEAPPPGGSSYIDQSVQALGQVGRPLHISDICNMIAQVRGVSGVARASVESSLVRHINSLGDRARVVRTGRSTYGLPQWPRVDVLPLRDAS